MTGRQGTYPLWKNPEISEKQHRALWMMIQVLSFGLMLGIISRTAWDYGIVASIALALKDLGLAIWVMIQDLAAACCDFYRFILP
jgi:hypothetical protein